MSDPLTPGLIMKNMSELWAARNENNLDGEKNMERVYLKE